MAFTTALHQSRLNHLTGTGYPATPVGNYIGLFAGVQPTAAGAVTAVTELTGTRPAITLGSPTQDVNGRWYVTHAAAVTTTLSAGGSVTGWGLFAANTGGTPLYFERLPQEFTAATGASVTIPAGMLKIYSDQ